MSTRYLFALVFLLVVGGASVHMGRRADEPNIDNLIWGPCTDLETDKPEVPILCAELLVPLDYLDESSTEKLSLKLLKRPAVKEPHLGSILINFGGPGALCREILAQSGDKYMQISGGQHDLITWDPRGTSETLPLTCFEHSKAKRAQHFSSRVSDEDLPDAHELKLVWKARGQVASACEAYAAREGSLVGTAYSVRDMLQIVDTLEAGEGGLLRFWGFSAGSTLGATFVAMFPDRADKVLLDGIENLHEMTHDLGDSESISSFDKLVTNIITACVQLPDGCPLANSKDESVDSIESRLLAAFAKLWKKPLRERLFTGRKLSWLRSHVILLKCVYFPSIYPDLIAGLAGLLRNKAAPMLKLEDTLYGQDKPETIEIRHRNLEGIRCGDQKPRLTELVSDEGIRVIDAYLASSLWIGKIMTFATWMYCAQWKMDARERYEGDFDVDTALKGPGMLIIANSVDPATPWVSALNMSTSLKNSVLLRHNGNGHCSTAQRSDCTEKIIREYFTNGLLPDKDTVCEPNQDLVEYLLPSANSKAKLAEDRPFWMGQRRRELWL